MSNRFKLKCSPTAPIRRDVEPTQADWDRAETLFQQANPVCPDCGSDWVIDDQMGSVSYGNAGETWVDIAAQCAAVKANEDQVLDVDPFADFDVTDHPITENGWIHFEHQVSA